MVRLAGGAGAQLALQARLPQDLLGKLVTTAHALAGGMVGAVLIGVDQMQDQPGQVLGAGGAAVLVLGNAQALALFGCGQHAVHKVIALAVHPAAANDEMLVGELLHIVLPRPLGRAVHRLGVSIVKFTVGLFGMTVEHVVGGQLHHLRPHLAGHKAQVACAQGVDLVGQFRVLLTQSNVGDRRAVNDHIRPVDFAEAEYLVGIGNIQFSPVGVEGLHFQWVQDLVYRRTNLAFRTGDPYFQHR